MGKQRLEQEKRDKWLAEAREQAEAEQNLIVKGSVVAVTELRKKGHLLIEVLHGEDEERAQIVVVDREVHEGQIATIALEGAVLPSGKTAKRQKVAGEWSEGELLEVSSAAAATEAVDIPAA